MQNLVNQAAATGGDAKWVQDQLLKNAPDYHVPPDATITATNLDKRVQVRVQFKRPIVTPFYTYDYEFDHTVQSSTFLTR